MGRGIVVAGGAVLLLLIACSGGRDSGWVVLNQESKGGGSPITLTGVVRHARLEGGFYTIQADDGVTYDPMNLPPDFRQDGLAVEAVARRRNDRLGTHQAGRIIELERIRRR
jgi:hypothetical protein